MDVGKACIYASSGGFAVACTGGLNCFENNVMFFRVKGIDILGNLPPD